MRVIKTRNVHDALPKGLDLLHGEHYKQDSRNGKVYKAKSPVCTVYDNPQERVMFWPERDANPFFHFMEGLWMIAGRNDLEFVKQYNKGMARYSDDGETLHGAYGWRWRNWFFERGEPDQLKVIIKRLAEDPTDRRCVLQMWDAVEDLDRVGVDVPCNTAIYFNTSTGKLHMTVTNRSNDIIWGAYGANAVHMSMLHEYIAAHAGYHVGKYYQFSNDYHAYEEIYGKLIKGLGGFDPTSVSAILDLMEVNPYKLGQVSYYPMVSVSREAWDEDLHRFLARRPFDTFSPYEEKFFNDVAVPMQDAWALHKLGKTEEAMDEIQNCEASDWKKACGEWFKRRIN